MRIEPINLPYQSIACGAYDVLEASAMRKRLLRLALFDGTILDGTLLDVFARGKEEFCRIRLAEGEPERELRLDAIQEIVDLENGTRTTTQAC
jgi:transcriptional antiterminator Rof (Rho-off)